MGAHRQPFRDEHARAQAQRYLPRLASADLTPEILDLTDAADGDASTIGVVVGDVPLARPAISTRTSTAGWSGPAGSPRVAARSPRWSSSSPSPRPPRWSARPSTTRRTRPRPAGGSPTTPTSSPAGGDARPRPHPRPRPRKGARTRLGGGARRGRRQAAHRRHPGGGSRRRARLHDLQRPQRARTSSQTGSGRWGRTATAADRWARRW